MAGTCWFLFRRLDGETWQLLVEGEVEHEGASPSVRPEWALIAVKGLCWLWGWFTGICCDCISVEVEKLLPLRSFSVEKLVLLSCCCCCCCC